MPRVVKGPGHTLLPRLEGFHVEAAPSIEGPKTKILRYVRERKYRS